MSRLLLVAYSFPPDPVPGALRPGYIAQYLPQFGWEVTILTHSSAEPPFPARVVRVGARASSSAASPARKRPRDSTMRAILRAIRNAVIFPDEMAPWILPAIARGLRVLRNERFDAILTTALPTSAHVVGACLSALTRTPWIADYRDAWSGNPYMPWGPVKRRLQRVAEKAAVGRAAQLTTVSEPIAEHLRSLHQKPVSVIENAYDTAEWEAIPDAAPQGFDLVYTGTMYAGKRSAEPLFAAVAQLRSEGNALADAVRVHFYGHNNEQVMDEAALHGVADCVRLHGVVPRVEAMRAQRKAAGLLIFLNMDAATAGERGSKYLEYIGARRAMLVFGPPASVMRETVERGGLGWFASDAAGAKSALQALYERYSGGLYELRSDASFVPSSIDLARMFAACLDRAVRDPRSPARPAQKEAAVS